MGLACTILPLQTHAACCAYNDHLNREVLLVTSSANMGFQCLCMIYLTLGLTNGTRLFTR
jgi:hypothetical protein